MRRRWNWLLRTSFALLLIAGGLASQPVAAQDPGTEGAVPPGRQPTQVEAPEADDYLWIAGSSFKPRSTGVSYSYASNGCLVSNTGGSSLDESFTVSFRVPDSSVLRGVRFYYYDTSSDSSSMSITSYDGAGNFTDHVLGASQDSAGYGDTYLGLTTPYTIATFTRGFVINWYPNVAGSSMRLCGARIFYDAGAPTVATADAEPAPAPAAADADLAGPNSPLASDYYFLAGSSFERVDSDIEYQYGSSGCMYSTTSYNALTIDLNIPDGSTLMGARFYFNDTDAASDIQAYLVDYTGLGGIRTLMQVSSSGSAGYSSVYAGVISTYTPYKVDQFNYALNAVVTGAKDATRQLCGVRVFYSPPTARPAYAAEVAPAGPLAKAQEPVADALDAPQSPSALSAAFATDLQLPAGAVVSGLRLFYYNTQQPDGSIELWNYNGTVANYLGLTTGNTYTGYDSIYANLGTPYTVNHAAGSLGLVPRVVYSPYYRFCGVRVFYSEGSSVRYRFIAATSFHPRSSAIEFDYRSPGCLSIKRQFVFLPLLMK